MADSWARARPNYRTMRFPNRLEKLSGTRGGGRGTGGEGGKRRRGRMPLRSILRQSWARIGDRMEATLGLSLALWGPLEGHITGSSIGPCVPRIRLETFRGTRSRRAMRSGDVRGSAEIRQDRHEVVRGVRLYGLRSSLRTLWSSTTACSSDVEDAICICSPKLPMRVPGWRPWDSS